MRKIIFGSIFILLSGIVVYYVNKYIEESRYKGLLICEHINWLDKNTTYSNILNVKETKDFYELSCKKSKMLPWFDGELKLKNQNKELLEAIKESYKHGLNHENYHLVRLENDIQQYSNTVFETLEEQARVANKLDVMLSDAYIALFNDSYYGLTDWKKFKKLQSEHDREEAKNKEEAKIAKLFETNTTNEVVEEEKIRKFEWDKPNKPKLFAANELIVSLFGNNIYKSLIKLHPNSKEYNRLLKVLDSYRQSNNSDNVKINKILLNLERFRWIAVDYDKSPKSLNINIPTFRMQILENGEEAWSMKVIVGKPQRPTPILDGVLSYAILNPYWTAPQTVLREDIMKKADTMAEYLASHNMKVFIKDQNGKKPIDPKNIDWASYKGKPNIPFIFRAEPGKDNPLGTIKFTFPNNYSVYMHDTNKKEFFDYDYRAFSSGCVRLSEPIKLLGYFLGENDELDLNSLNKKNDPEHPISLKMSIPVVFRYMTVSVDKDLNIKFYDDIYGYDETNMQAIKDFDKLFK